MFCPGYLRGLAFVGDYAVVGLSRPRDDKTFGGLALTDELARRSADARCGLLIIDLRTGNVAHWLRSRGFGARTLRCGRSAGSVPADGAGVQDRRDRADDRRWRGRTVEVTHGSTSAHALRTVQAIAAGAVVVVAAAGHYHRESPTAS